MIPFGITCEHIEPWMQSLVISDDEAREEDNNNNDCTNHEANDTIVTFNERHITEIEVVLRNASCQHFDYPHLKNCLTKCSERYS